MDLIPIGPYGLKGDPGVVLALYGSDPSYMFEIQRSPDSGGVPSGAWVTIATNVLGTEELYIDPQPLDNTQRWYRIRCVGLGDTPSAWLGNIPATPATIPSTVSRPAAVLPTYTEAKSISGNTATLAVTVTDPQLRLVSFELRGTTGGVVGGWGGAGGVPFLTFTASQTVTTSPGANAFLEYRAQGYAGDGVLKYLTTATVPMNLDADPAGPIHLAFDSTGNVVLSLNGSDKTLSWSYAYSSSAMPSDATAIAGTVVNGRVVRVSIGVGLALGGHLYVKAVSWSGASATGIQGQIVSAETERQNQTTTGKRLIFPGVLAQPVTNAMDFLRSNGTVSNLSTTAAVDFEMPLDIPNGVTITQIESNSYRTNAGDVATVTFYYAPRGGGAATVIGATHTNSTTGGVQLITTSSLSVVVDHTTYFYYAAVRLTSASVAAAVLYDLGIVYTSPDLATGT